MVEGSFLTVLLSVSTTDLPALSRSIVGWGLTMWAESNAAFRVWWVDLPLSGDAIDHTHISRQTSVASWQVCNYWQAQRDPYSFSFILFLAPSFLFYNSPLSFTFFTLLSVLLAFLLSPNVIWTDKIHSVLVNTLDQEIFMLKFAQEIFGDLLQLFAVSFDPWNFFNSWRLQRGRAPETFLVFSLQTGIERAWYRWL